MKVQIFETFECSGQNSLNSCHFWNRSFFLQILHQSSESWDMTAMYFFSWNFIYFQQNESIKVQSWWNFKWAVESLKFHILMGSFCPNHVHFQLRKYKKVISWHWRVMLNLNKAWPCGFKTGMWNWVNFHWSAQKSKNLYFWWALFIQNLMFQLENFRGIMCHDTEMWHKIKVKTDSSLEKWQGICLIFMQAVESLKMCTWWVHFFERI